MSDDKTVQMLPLKRILLNPEFNCRGPIPPIDVVELANDIRIRAERGNPPHGLLQPILVMPLKDDPDHDYLLLVGHRRATAFKVLERSEIPAIILPEMPEEEARCINLGENLHRANLNIKQEANALRHLKNLGCTREYIVKKLNMSHGWVQIRLMLLELPSDIQDQVVAGFITQDQVRKLYTRYCMQNDKKGAYDMARGMIEAKEKGIKYREQEFEEANTQAPKKNAKVPHTKNEINNMLERILNTFGTCMASKALAWASGDLCTEDFEEYLRDRADENNVILV